MAKEIWLFARQDFDERVFTNPYEPVDLKRVMTARKKYFTTSAEKQSAKAARRKSRRLLNEYCKEEHKATLRKWHEELQENAAIVPVCGVAQRLMMFVCQKGFVLC